jgi:hypothetical protein
MQIRRPIAALFAALAVFGGGATLSGCASYDLPPGHGFPPPPDPQQVQQLHDDVPDLSDGKQGRSPGHGGTE